MTGWVMSEHGVPDSRLKVIKCVGVQSGQHMWQCICSCLDHNEVVVSGGNLRNGHTLSCGCLQRERIGNVAKKHGDSHNRLYTIWCGIKGRCFNKNNDAYVNYGARGIKVCDEWTESYDIFKDWALNNGYSDSLTIDRIDVNGDYTPLNCRWITMKKQCNNKRTNTFIEHNGESHTISEWSEITGIKAATIAYRLRHNWSIDKALSKLK